MVLSCSMLETMRKAAGNFVYNGEVCWSFHDFILRCLTWGVNVYGKLRSLSLSLTVILREYLHWNVCLLGKFKIERDLKLFSPFLTCRAWLLQIMWCFWPQTTCWKQHSVLWNPQGAIKDLKSFHFKHYDGYGICCEQRISIVCLYDWKQRCDGEMHIRLIINHNICASIKRYLFHIRASLIRRFLATKLMQIDIFMLLSRNRIHLDSFVNWTLNWARNLRNAWAEMSEGFHSGFQRLTEKHFRSRH